MGEPGFWDHPENAKTTVVELKALKAAIDPVENLLTAIEDLRALYQLGQEVSDQDTLVEADRTLGELERRAAQVELQSLLDGPNDGKNCFFTIQAGAGG